jgi:RNA polymerase sigma-70 factor, ECF subfamily
VTPDGVRALKGEGVIDEREMRGLVARAQSLDPEAWTTLYENAYGRLYRYARRRLPNNQAADDAVSETIARALDRIDRFAWAGAGFDAWLYGILRNVVREARRASARWAGEDQLPSPVLHATPVDDVLATEEAATVREAFGRLRPEDQELLELRVVAGMSAEDVAHVQGRRPGAVRMAQSRALARLRELMAEAATDV